jgi:hypothetical protein
MLLVPGSAAWERVYVQQYNDCRLDTFAAAALDSAAPGDSAFRLVAISLQSTQGLTWYVNAVVCVALAQIVAVKCRSAGSAMRHGIDPVVILWTYKA